MSERVPLIRDGENYLLSSEENNVQVRLIRQVGEGGTYLVYKAVEEVDGVPQNVCIIKEAYPRTEEESFSKLQYVREEPGQEIRLMPRSFYMNYLSEEQKASVYHEERMQQEENAFREVQMARELFFNKEKQENSPYLYRTEFFARMGDTYYLKLDTSEGQTLHSYSKENERGHLSLQESLQMTKKLLEILTQVFGDAYLHGDIKPQNIWIRGHGEAMSMVLLDMGSAFSLQGDYCCKGYESWTEADVIQKADFIVKNRGIGCSTKGYCSPEMNAFFDAKAAYYSARELAVMDSREIIVQNQMKAAARLLEAMNRLNVTADLYGVVETMYYCATGRNYDGETETELEELLQETIVVCQCFADILKKNREAGYVSIEALQKDLHKLECIMNRDADPEVLLDAIRHTLPDIQHIDPRLFGKIK